MQSPHAFRTFATPAAVLWVVSLLLAGCGGEDIVAPTTGQIEVTVSTSGAEQDPDGYSLSLDGGPDETIDLNATRTLTVEAGDHALELRGLAPNCGVDAGTQRQVSVAVGATVAVGFEVVCRQSSGGLRVVTATTGFQLDPDGYLIQIDEGEPRPVAVNGSLTVTGLPVGDRTVRISGLAENCTLAGEPVRTATVPPGELAAVAFEIDCVATLGRLVVTTSTTGSSPDPDGYTVQVQGSQGQSIGPNSSLTIPDLAPGTYSVLLGELAGNCVVQGDNPRTVEVPAGGDATIEFAIACTGAMLRWTALASGSRADLPEVWGASATDVFVVGERSTATDLESVILHYDGSRFERQLREEGLRLRGVWGSSGTDVYAVGFDFFSPDARVLRYDGTGWTNIPGFVSDEFEELRLLSVWGTSATDVFTVGAAFDGEFDRSLIYHFDGTRWERMRVDGFVDPGLTDVWGSSPTDVYAVGQDDLTEPSTGVILRYDGSAWTPVLEVEDLLLNSIWGSSATDVFAAGFQVTFVGEEPTVAGAIYHFDGTAWTRMPLPTTQILHELWGTSPSDVYAVGQDGVILHYDGNGWTATNPTTNTLLGVWGSSPAEVFAVGNRGTVLRGAP